MSETKTNTLEFNSAAKKMVANLLSPLKQGLFLFSKLPGAWFMGTRVKSLTPTEATVAVKYGWRSQNPFKSMYFATQAAAAELSTGVLCMAHLQGKPTVSMLVKDMQADFIKRGTGLVVFTCSEGARIAEAVQKALDTNEGQTITVESIGTQTDVATGESFVVSKFKFTWTFKKR